MRVPAFSIKAAISTCLVTFMLAPLPSLAALASGDSDRLDQYEKTVFGSVRKTMSEESRLRAIETNLFGKAKSGSAKTRLNAIAKLVAPSASGTQAKVPQYLPPMAAALDSSAFPEQPEANIAKQRTEAITANGAGSLNDYTASPSQKNYQTEPEPVDHVKQLLRDALQKHTQGDRNGAQKLFKQVLTLDPRNGDANFNLGAMAEDAGDITGAQRYYSAAASANPNDSEVKDALASVNNKLQNQQQAREIAAQSAKKDELRKIAQDAAVAYKAGHYDQAISALERIDREAPGDANVKYGLGQAYRGKGDMGRARANLAAAASIDPNNPLYRTTLTELDRQQQGRQQQIANQPQGSNSNPYGNGSSSLPAGMRDYGSESAPQIGDDFNSGAQPGTLTPFANEGGGRLYGQAVGGQGINMGGLGSIGLGGLAGMLGGRRVSNPEEGRGTRLVRSAVRGSLSGAAMGAIAGMATNGRGGMKSGAMKGAMYGGLFGLLSGF